MTQPTNDFYDVTDPNAAEIMREEWDDGDLDYITTAQLFAKDRAEEIKAENETSPFIITK